MQGKSAGEATDAGTPADVAGRGARCGELRAVRGATDGAEHSRKHRRVVAFLRRIDGGVVRVSDAFVVLATTPNATSTVIINGTRPTNARGCNGRTSVQCGSQASARAVSLRYDLMSSAILAASPSTHSTHTKVRERAANDASTICEDVGDGPCMGDLTTVLMQNRFDGSIFVPRRLGQHISGPTLSGYIGIDRVRSASVVACNARGCTFTRHVLNFERQRADDQLVG